MSGGMTLKLYPQNAYVAELYLRNTPSQFASDSGFDLYFPETVTITAGETKMIDLQIIVEAVDNGNDKPCGFMLFPRSSIIKTPLRMSNSIGLVDCNYRGTLRVCVDNIKTTDYIIERGQRLFQIVGHDLKPSQCVIVDSVSNTDRGSGGFGSTGV